MKTVVLAVVLLVGLGMMAGCAGSDSKDDTGPVLLYANDSGRTIRVVPGTEIRITLEGNPTTGYTWEVRRADPSLLIAGEHAFHPSSNMPGAGGVWVFPFEAAAQGTGEIRLIYHRPWEKAAPLRAFSVKVEVGR